MPKIVALIIFISMVIFLLMRDLNREPKISTSIWIPILWILIIGSRAVSLWFNMGITINSPDDYLEGSPLDRNIFLALIFIGVVVLWRRKVDWDRILHANPWFFLLIFYGGISILWSDFPFVSLKRWIKAIGNIIMILVVLTDSEPIEALKALFRRATFVLIPISVLLIKYYPEYGRYFHRWTYGTFYGGVTTNKNALGYICLVFGIFFFWSFLSAWYSNVESRDRKEISIQMLILLMISWLFLKANSVTSLICFVLGVFIIYQLINLREEGNVRLVNILAVVVIFAFLLVALGFGTEMVLTSVGRDLTLTGRTELWKTLVGMHTNPVFGIGYEAFWLGNRSETLWDIYYWHPNQAHNGYLEAYLNLGFVGVFMLFGVIASTYRSIRKALTFHNESAIIFMAFLIIFVFYNFTESAVKSVHLVWFVFNLTALSPYLYLNQESALNT